MTAFPVRHWTEVEQTSDGWDAYCVCSWESTGWEEIDEALDAARDHEKEVS